MSAVQATTPSDHPLDPEVEAALAYHNGDAAAAIATLLEDVRFLKSQLAMASGAMSRGLTRGWEPKYDRD